MKNKDNVYLPRERSWYEPTKSDLVSGPKNGVKTKLPNTTEDPIVVNNIACNEFDYTEEPFVDKEIDTNP